MRNVEGMYVNIRLEVISSSVMQRREQDMAMVTDLIYTSNIDGWDSFH